MKKRHGHTLIEAVTTFALMGAVMTTVAVSMSGMQRANQRIRGEIAVERDLQRFSVLFRADAHAAQSASRESAGDGATTDSLVLALDGQDRVRYTLAAGGLTREHLRGEERLHGDTFQLSEAHRATWELDETGSATLVTLKLEPESTDMQGDSGDHVIQIQAAVGLMRQPLEQHDS